ncbi:MAG: CidA/LrgA family protein [Sphingomonadaceae bacterium]|nr:CidA/LrgA family protein [Sphingomonadaceae bacterium]
MRRTAGFIASIVLLFLLARIGDAAVAAFALPVPGAGVGLAAYLVLLATGLGEGSIPAARGLAGLLGALIVPPLVGVATFAPVLAAGGWRLAAALVAGVVVTGVVTAATVRFTAR